VCFYDVNKVFISTGTFNAVPSNAYYVRWTYTGEDINVKAQLEEGTQPTPYEPYKQVLPSAQTGLRMDGVKDYLQLPSMTMDSIEIDCLIDSVQQNNAYLTDVRPEIPNSYFYNGGIGAGWSDVQLNGSSISKSTFTAFSIIPRNQRIKLKLITTPFTKALNIFGTGASTAMKGTLYAVTCYLNGQVVARYDFTNPNNIVGDKVLEGTARNLIPSFEDARWNLHGNAKVLGKDVMRLDATASNQNSDILLDSVSGKDYLAVITTSGGNQLNIYDGTDGSYINTSLNAYVLFKAKSSKTRLQLKNAPTGTLDFIRPQLFELNGKEATLYGAPVRLLKAPKRVLYAKR
jgi:hypothetical protein